MSDFCSKGYDIPRLQPLGGGGGGPSFKGLLSISNREEASFPFSLACPNSPFPFPFPF